MFAIPADSPVTIPVDPTDAMDVLLLLQLPPVVSSTSVFVNPTQTKTEPVMAAGNEFIVTKVVAVQPVPSI